MQKTAVGIMLAGFVLTSFSLYAFGIDLLIDAVGFLLIFNAARALAGWAPVFKPASLGAAALVAVSALQLFVAKGMAALVLSLLRAAGETVLYLLLAVGMGGLLALGKQKFLAPLARAAFGLGAATCAAAAFLPLILPPAAAVCAIAFLASRIFMVFLLFFACILPDSLLY